MINNNSNNINKDGSSFEKNSIVFDPEELKESDMKLFKLLIHYANLFYIENMFDLGDKLINIAQNYYLTKIFY
jgi:hypothetical protein